MYTGHIGIALAARGAHRSVNLWLLCTAALMPDLIDFAPVPWDLHARVWTHTLPDMLVEGCVFFAAGWLVSRSLAAGLITGLTACSHVPADLLTSRLTFWPGGQHYGLHWYRYPLLDFTLEALVVLAGWWLYGRTLPPSRRFSPASFAILVLLLSLQGFLATQDVS
jgi:hypothetical protein